MSDIEPVKEKTLFDKIRDVEDVGLLHFKLLPADTCQVDVHVADMFGGKSFSRVFVGALISPYMGMLVGHTLLRTEALSLFEKTMLGCVDPGPSNIDTHPICRVHVHWHQGDPGAGIHVVQEGAGPLHHDRRFCRNIALYV